MWPSSTGSKRIGLDRIVHPGAGDALADEDEQMRAGKRIVLGAAAMEHGMRHHRIGELDRHARKHLAEHAANERDVAGNDRIDELAQAAKAGDRNADLREPDPAPPRPVAQQLQRIVKHPADGFDRRRFRQRQAFGVMQFARKPADADARTRAGQLECRKRAPNYRATPDRSGRRNKGQAASPPRSGLRPSGQTGCATGSLRTGAPPWPAAAGTCRRTGADAPEWPRASAAGFSAAPDISIPVVILT